MIAETLDFI